MTLPCLEGTGVKEDQDLDFQDIPRSCHDAAPIEPLARTSCHNHWNFAPLTTGNDVVQLERHHHDRLYPG